MGGISVLLLLIKRTVENLKMIEKLPAGVIVELYKKLSEVSGIEIDDGKLKDF